ncbi:cytochrome b N-terminal domain-containing protein, partial [Acidobacteriota bacterium]
MQGKEGNKRATFANLMVHIHPRTVPETTLRFTLTWGLGGMSLTLLFLQAVTGILLRVLYEPTPALAYDSIVVLQRDVLFGQWIRNIHYWGANFLMIIIVLHLLRIFFTGAFHAPRQFNWIIGLILLLFVIFFNFTGYLLPWDQLSYWAVTVSIGMMEYVPVLGSWLQGVIRGGPEMGPSTLLLFNTLHNAVLPFLLVLFLPLHF